MAWPTCRCEAETYGGGVSTLKTGPLWSGSNRNTWGSSHSARTSASSAWCAKAGSSLVSVVPLWVAAARYGVSMWCLPLGRPARALVEWNAPGGRAVSAPPGHGHAGEAGRDRRTFEESVRARELDRPRDRVRARGARLRPRAAQRRGPWW